VCEAYRRELSRIGGAKPADNPAELPIAGEVIE
jgi:hypothetical protein